MIFSKLLAKNKKLENDQAASLRATKEAEKNPVPGRAIVENNNTNKKETNRGRERIKIDLLIHDLKVPLAVLDAGLTALMKRQERYGAITEKQERVLTRALRNTRVIQMLVNDALELGRSREGIINLTNFTLSSLIEKALVEIFDLVDTKASEKIRGCARLKPLKEALQEKGIILLVNEDLWCEELRMDEGKVTQILRNLLSNALKYRKNRVEIKVVKKDECLVFSVKDDGEGIPSVHHKQIFEKYFQMDAVDNLSVRGHGLGLAGVMVLVEDMGGKLSLASDVGMGARFMVEVPFCYIK